jgi:hypothetical protein
VRDALIPDIAEPVIGRAFARPVRRRAVPFSGVDQHEHCQWFTNPELRER